MKKLGQKLPPLNKSKPSKKSQKEVDEINRRMTEVNFGMIGNFRYTGINPSE